MQYFIVSNIETLNGQVCDTTERAFEDYASAETRFYALVDSAFRETHPQGDIGDDEYADMLSLFVNDNVDGDMFNYEQDGHTYHTEITIRTLD